MLSSVERNFKKHMHTVLCYPSNEICLRLAKSHKFINYNNRPSIKAEIGLNENRMTFGYDPQDKEINQEKFLTWIKDLIEKRLEPEFLTEETT